MLINDITNQLSLLPLLQFKMKEQKVMKKIQENIRSLIVAHMQALREEERNFWYKRFK